MDMTTFKNYFEGDAPVIQVPGRLYPIKLQYHPIPAIEQSSKTDKLNPAPYVRVLQLIDSKYPESERGDVLIFLSGIKEITTVADACKEYAEKNNNDLIFGHLGSFVKDYFYLYNLRKWLEEKGYNFAPDTTDFYKQIPTNLPYYDEFYTNIKD